MLIKKLGVSLIFSLFLVALTNAAQVTSNSDGGEGSLRQVISDSEEGDTITFSDSFTITIATPITIDKDIVIDGGTISSLTLGFNSKAGTQYKIMYSEDLSNWEVLKNVQSIGETTEISIDIQTDNFKSLFYKVRETFE